MSLMSQRETWFHSVVRSRALTYLPLTAFGIDLALISLSTLVAGLIRQSDVLLQSPAELHSTVAVAGPGMVATWLICLVLAGGYDTPLFEAGTDGFRRLTAGSLSAAGLVGVGAYLLDYPLSRGFYFIAFVLGLVMLVLGRFALRALIRAARRHGTLRQSVLIVGSRFGVDEVASVITREQLLGYQVIGCLTPANDPAPETDAGIPVLGDCESVTEQVVASGADVVFFASGGLTSAGQMRSIAWDLEHHDVRVVVAPGISEVSGDRVRIRPVGGLPLIHLDPPRATDAARWGKRTLDIVGSVVALVLALPVLLFAAARVKLADGGPVFFRQMRTGRHGEEFSLLKFRTMSVDAEERLAALQAQEGFDGGLFKMAQDPRVTAPGRWLRRFSIDELPQLLNVLRGEMSLVGPRPPLPAEVALYSGSMSRRLHVRPGLTGLWQISGRSNLTYDEAIRLDLFYVDNWSMFQDLSILLKTVGAVVRPKGAY